MEQLRTFEGGLNLDDSLKTLPPGDYPFMLNASKVRTITGKNGSVENIMSTIAMSGIGAMNSNSTCVGTIRDRQTQSWFLFFYNTSAANNCIVKYTGGAITLVLQWSGLNFDLSHKINGGALVNNILYWTDNYNQPRCVNISKYSGGGTPLSEEELALIKRGPQIAATFVKSFDGATTVDNTGKYGFQFSYQYIYEDGQQSVIAPWSILCPQNTALQNYNKIAVTITGEAYPYLVNQIKFIARVGNAGVPYYIGSVKSANYPLGGASAFAASITLNYYNNTNGNPIDSDYGVQFHAIPPVVKCLEYTKNRLWLGNYVDGYDNAVAPPLSLTPSNALTINGSPVTSTDPLYKVETITVTGGVVGSPVLVTNRAILVSVTMGGSDPNGCGSTFYQAQYTLLDSATPANIITSGVIITGTNQFAVAGSTYQRILLTVIGSVTYVSGTLNVTPFDGQRTFPTGSSYKFGVVYKDSSGRSGGVASDPTLVMNTPKVYYNQLTCAWTLASGFQVAIPTWASYYSIVMSNNLSKSFFFEYKSVNLAYYDRATTPADHSTYLGDYAGIRLDIMAAINSGIGYTFVAGDRIILYGPNTAYTATGQPVSATNYDLPIVKTDGQYIYMANTNIGAIAETKIYFEIYRPITQASDILYYETGNCYAITNPGTGSRAYSSLTGVFNGDSVNVIRSNYKIVSTGPTVYGVDVAPLNIALFKAMSIAVNGVWDTDQGKPYVETIIGSSNKSSFFKNSQEFLLGTSVNGLSEFYVADENNISSEAGGINKLKASIRDSEEGSVLLAIGRNDTYSIYVGQQYINTTGGNIGVLSSSVVGDVRPLKGGYGTQNPEGVHEQDGYVYWWDLNRRRFVRYATNGLFPTSEYKMVTHFENIAAANTSTDRVAIGYDPYYRLIIVTFKNPPAAGTDTASKKTVAWNETNERWESFMSYTPDEYFNQDGILFSIVAGTVYRHNDQSTYNSFYGTSYNTIIDCSFNDNAQAPKEWRAIESLVNESMITWASGVQSVISSGLKINLDAENGQGTDILYNEFDVNEYMIYGAIRKDTNSSGGIKNGDDMVSSVIKARATLSAGVVKQLYFLKIGYELSKGHLLTA